jgi:DNA repair exonuclease SbcCD ATPase subunit
VILVSAEATQKTFDDHRKLKVGRADEYLRKPIAPDALIEKIEGLIGPLAEEVAAIDLEEEALTAIDDASAMVAEEPIHLEEMEEISVDSDDHEAAPTPDTLPSDSELDLLDAAFDNLEQKPAAEKIEKEETHDLVEIEPETEHEEPTSSPALRLIADEEEPEASTAAAKVDDDAFSLPEEEPSEEARPSGGGRDKEYFQLKERLAQREKDLVRVREELAAREKELVQLREHETELERELEGKQPQIKAALQKTEALMAGQRRAEKELSTLREDLKQATSRLQSAERERDGNKSTVIEQAANLEKLKVELNRAEQRARDAEKKLQSTGSHAEELGAELAGVRAQLEKGEDRLLRAYQRIKGDERLKEKTRKALSIALQLLEDTSSEEEERRT